MTDCSFIRVRTVLRVLLRWRTSITAPGVSRCALISRHLAVYTTSVEVVLERGPLMLDRYCGGGGYNARVGDVGPGPGQLDLYLGCLGILNLGPRRVAWVLDVGCRVFPSVRREVPAVTVVVVVAVVEDGATWQVKIAPGRAIRGRQLVIICLLSLGPWSADYHHNIPQPMWFLFFSPHGMEDPFIS